MRAGTARKDCASGKRAILVCSVTRPICSTDMLQAALGHDDEAVARFSRSAEGAARGGFLNDAGLAEEFLARWRLAAGDQAAAKSAAIAACRTYRAWGAMAKVALLEQMFGLSAADMAS